jgi:hypothetical protein
MRPADRVLERLDGVERRNGYHMALCPAHEDHTPSLSITEGDDGRTLLHCHAGCAPENIVLELGLTMGCLFPQPERNGNERRKVVEYYDYHDAQGQTLFQTVRMAPKDFRQRRPDGRGGWEWNLKGVDPVLYRLPEVRQAVESGETVFVLEGEKDVDRARSVGLYATTNPMGAGKWRDVYSETLRGANVVIVPDNDRPGREHGKQVARSLQEKAASVKIVELPGLPDSGDLSDWLDAGGSAEDLEHMAREASEVSLSSSLNDWGRQGHSASASTRQLKAVRFCDLTDPGEREYLLEGLVLQTYLTMLYGDGGVAKSLLALALAIAVVRGAGEFLGREVRSTPVLFVDFELDEGEQYRRACQLAKGAGLEEPPEDLYYLSALGHSPREALEAALEECKRLGVGLCIIDSYGLALQGNAEGAGDVIGFNTRYLEPFRAEDVAILIVDHQSKPQGGQRYQDKRPFGSTYKGLLARSVVQVEATERGENSLTVRLRQTKHNFGTLAEPFGARLTFGEDGVEIEEAELDAAELAEEQTLNSTDRVKLALEAGPAFPAEIADASGLALKTVKNVLSSLRKDGEVKDTGKTEGQSKQVSLVSSHLRDRDTRDTHGASEKCRALEPGILGTLEECIHAVPGGCWLCRKSNEGGKQPVLETTGAE